jgi:hypothetical protein
MSEHNQYICLRHSLYNVAEIFPLSPCRAKCDMCKNKNVHGYSNPEHVSNPFGYCYLCPVICINCAVKHKKCIWCQ